MSKMNRTSHNNTHKSTRVKANRRKSNLLISTFIIVSLLIITLSVGSIIVKASDSGNKKTFYKYYTSITINDSDSLWSLEEVYNNGSEDRNTYINNVMKLNNMNTDTLYRGQNLLIYYYSEEVK